MRLAAIDIGTNSIHMIVAEVRPDGSFEIVQREKEMVRLGAGGLDGRAIGPRTMEAGLDVLARFARLAQTRGVDETTAVATSAVREASNGGDFLAQAAQRTGIQPRLISGLEEARLIHMAAVYGVEATKGRTIVIDIGGGSTEVSAGDARGMRSACSFKLGVLRLTERFVNRDPIARSAERRLVLHIRAEAGDDLKRLARAGFARVVGTSGTLLCLGQMALPGGVLFGRDTMHHARISADELHAVRQQLVRSDMRHRLRMPGLDARRVDLIVAGAVLADTLLGGLGATEITLCDFALREGLVLDYLARNQGRIARVERYPDIRRRSVMELGERCRWFLDHSLQVARLSLSIFDQTRRVHRLDDRAREWLEYAALLHDIGGHISYTNHHKHSYYLIQNGDLRGFEPVEIQAIALIARYHRKSPPKKSHEDFSNLPPAVRRAVRVASAILRIAESLDRSHAQLVRAVHWRQAGDGTTLTVHAASASELEIWAARRQAEPLESVLGMPLRIAAADIAARGPHQASSPSRTPLRRRERQRTRQDARKVAARKRAPGAGH